MNYQELQNEAAKILDKVPAGELAKLVERHGGDPEVKLAAEVTRIRAEIDECVGNVIAEELGDEIGYLEGKDNLPADEDYAEDRKEEAEKVQMYRAFAQGDDDIAAAATNILELAGYTVSTEYPFNLNN